MNLRFQFNETVDYRLRLSRLGIIQTSLAAARAAPSVVGNHFWKQMAHMLAYLFEIEMLQAAISWWMKENYYHHDFHLWHAAFTVILALSFCLKRLFCHLCIKNFEKIICNTENFRIFANYQIFNGLYFIELTLIQCSQHGLWGSFCEQQTHWQSAFLLQISRSAS